MPVPNFDQSTIETQTDYATVLTRPLSTARIEMKGPASQALAR